MIAGLIFIFLLFQPSVALAVDTEAPSAESVEQTFVNDLRILVEGLMDEVFETARREDLSRAEQLTVLRDLLEPQLHIEFMAQFALGEKVYGKMTEDEKTLYLSLFRDLVFQRYTAGLLDEKIQSVTLQPIVMPERGPLVRVSTTVIRENGEELDIQWTLVGFDVIQPSVDTLKIFDFSISGISFLLNRKADFRGSLRSKEVGGDMEKFLKKLSEEIGS